MIRRFLISLLMLSPCIAQAQLESTSDLNRGLVGWWKFDTGTGTNAFDLSGNNNTGALSGSTLPVWTNGVFGGALSFDGSHAYVAIGDPSSIRLTNTITLSAWVKRNRSETREIFLGKGGGSAGNTSYWFEISAANKVGFLVGQSPSTSELLIASSLSITDTTKWHHVAGTWNGTIQKVYLDGVVDPTTITWSGSIISTTDVFSIGELGIFGTLMFQGEIDDVRIYSRALSATEVLNLYCQGGGRTP